MRHTPTEQEIAKRSLRRPGEPGLPVLLGAGLLGALLVALLAWLCRGSGVAGLRHVHALINERGPVQYIELVMAFMLAGIAFAKWRALREQWGDLDAQPLAGVDLRGDASLQALREKLAAGPRFARSILFTRLERGIALWLGSKDLDRMGAWLATESQRETAASESSYALARFLIWAIPIMGFVGTVMGLAGAVGGFSLLGSAPDLLAIKNAIGQVTQSLGIAFETTLLALVLTVPLMLVLTFVQRNEERLLVEIDNYLDQVLLTHLPSSQKNPIVIENLEDALEAAFRRYIPDPDRYEDVFTRSIERAGASVEARFANLARDYAATLRDLTGQLGEHLAAVTEVTAHAVGNMLSEVRQVGRDETDRLRAMLLDAEERSREAMTSYQQAATRIQEAGDAAALRLSHQLGEVARLAAGVQELLKVEEALNRGLQSVTAGQDLQRTLEELRRQLAATTALCEQLGRPRVFTLQERHDGKE